MVKISSYLRSSDGTFIPIDEVTDPPADRQYIEGAIEFVIDDTVLLDVKLWDFVDQLWAYIANTVEEFSNSGHGSTYFPDQPILLELRRSGRDRVVVSVEAFNLPRREARAAASELLDALHLHGRSFFAKMTELLPEDRVANEYPVEQLRQAASRAQHID